MKTATEQVNARQPRVAVVTAIAAALLIVSGVGYRVVDARLSRLTGSTPIPKGTLARLPMQIGEWQGRDVPLSEAVIQATSTDDHINRVYARGSQAVSLFVAYGVRLRDLTPHRPEVCYRGAGWSLQSGTHQQVRSEGGAEVPVRLMIFNRNALQTEQVTVLNYYVVDGVYSADVSLLRDRAAGLAPGARYAAQIQITSSDPVAAGAEAQVGEFATASADLIRDLIAKAVEAVAAGQGGAE